jgi:hypothetical protein
VLWRYDGVRESSNSPFHALALHLRLGSLTASVVLDDFGTRPQDVATIDSLAGALVRRIAVVRANDEPGLSGSALRFAQPEEAPSWDNYVRHDGQHIRFFGESADAAAHREATYPDVEEIYTTYQTLAFGEADAADDILFRSYVYLFPDETAASAWTKAAAEGAPLIDGAPTFGDESFICQCGEDTGAGGDTLHGFAAVIRVGTRVALFQLYAVWDLSLDTLTEVAQTQAGCLANGNCLQPATFPDALNSTVGEDTPGAIRDAGAMVSQDFPAMIAPEEATS